MKNRKVNPLAPCIAILGTGSEVGKSIVTTALCRYFANRGINVAPYKSQNMSNNSGITPEGLEMGRAQIVQAEAARIPPHVDMNPILLKPTSDVGCQVVLLGKAIANTSAVEYHTKKEHLFSSACAALNRLRADHDLIIMEGAGSCVEVNLMEHDIVNFRMAEYAQAPVLLVADIHRGGVFAQIIGSLECMAQKHRDLVSGFIINRFRGDIKLFEDGVAWIEKKTGKKGCGVIPWYTHFTIEAEDSVVIESPQRVVPKDDSTPALAVIRIPHISNFTDFDPLSDLEGLNLYFLERAQDLISFKAVILPGSKNTRFDLQWLEKTGWTDKLATYLRQGGHLLGICGGYQMMGQAVHDLDGLEGTPGTTKGLGLLPVETFLKAPKTTTLTRFSWQGVEGKGYEIHMGETKRLQGEPMFSVLERNREPCRDEEGCIARDAQVMGTYVHGLFDTPGITKRWLNTIGLNHVEVSTIHGPAARDRDYDLLAAHFEKHIDTNGIVKIINSELTV
ncbi:MAG: cobyric acid synthase [Deltaproteobacteria bacterium]|nr:cobyric acid synthase [Deltaproteobacteria bacterium]